MFKNLQKHYSYVFAGILALGLGGATFPAFAVPVFGTGVGFDTNFYSTWTGITEGVAFGQITWGQSQADVTADNVYGHARARATTTANSFSLGAHADSTYAFYPRSAYSFAASGFTVSGHPNSFVNLIFTMDGGIFANYTAGGSAERGSAALYIYAAGDGNGGPVAYMDVSYSEYYGGFYASITDSNGQRSFQVGNQPNLSLSATIPVNSGPFLAMLATHSYGANVDFLNTATLTGAELSPGATLTLDTGQVFQSVLADAPGVSIPEPASLALLGVGLGGLVAARRRKKA